MSCKLQYVFLCWLGILIVNPVLGQLDIDVDGIGWLEGKSLEAFLELSLSGDDEFTSTDIEDGILLLNNRLRNMGHLDAEVTVSAGKDESMEEVGTFDVSGSPFVSGEYSDFDRIHFSVIPGQYYHFRNIEFQGLDSLEDSFARTFFIGKRVGLLWKKTTPFSPEALEKSVRNLQSEYESRGFINTNVEVASVDRTEEGPVDILLKVSEGKKHRISEIEVEWEAQVISEIESDVHELLGDFEGQKFNRSQMREIKREVRELHFEHGYADMSSEVRHSVDESQSADRHNVEVIIKPGERIKIGELRFTGNRYTRDRTLRRFSRLEGSKWLNPLEVEDARNQLTRVDILGRVRYQTLGEGSERDIEFDVEERKRWGSSLIFGYGTYEQLRIGAEVERLNIWGRGHNSRLRILQSMKSREVNLSYRMPQIFGELWEGNIRPRYMKREEVSFDKEEYGIAVGLRVPVKNWGGNLFFNYTLEDLNTSGIEQEDLEEAIRSARSASFETVYLRDFRDNPLYPSEGWLFRSSLEVATRFLGSEVNFGRFSTDISFHHNFNDVMTFHVGFRHGVLFTLGEANEDLPLNKRFFPGGDHSIRGFERGTATPVNDNGDYFGSEIVNLLNLEMEFPLIPNFNLVVFNDHLVYAEKADSYPGQDYLSSAGLGLRWRTIIGPVRLEYARNIEKRDFDPNGRWHISIGFPF